MNEQNQRLSTDPLIPYVYVCLEVYTSFDYADVNTQVIVIYMSTKYLNAYVL